MHYCDSSEPLLKLVKFDNLDIFFYKYEKFDLLGKDANHYNDFVQFFLELSNLF